MSRKLPGLGLRPDSENADAPAPAASTALSDSPAPADSAPTSTTRPAKLPPFDLRTWLGDQGILVLRAAGYEEMVAGEEDKEEAALAGAAALLRVLADPRTPDVDRVLREIVKRRKVAAKNRHPFFDAFDGE